MLNNRKIKRSNRNIIYTVTASLLVCVVFLLSIGYVYKRAEEEGFEQLHMQTKQIKEDLTLQIMSDRENLFTMAGFASNLYAEGKDFSLLFDSFESIGLIEKIRVLMPDNTLITKDGVINLDGKISFEEEASKGFHTSGRVTDLKDSDREVIRNSVPITYDGHIVGILYGLIEFDELNKRYSNIVSGLEAQLYVFEKGNGNILIDTYVGDLKNISVLKDREYKKGFSYQQMMDSDSGYSSFISKYTNELQYVHYSHIDIEDWYIMLVRPEKAVFKHAHRTAVNLIFAFWGLVLILVLYLAIMMKNEKRKSKISVYGSNIRKLLLEINQQDNNISEALQNIAEFSKARSAFFVDTDGEEYKYILPRYSGTVLSAEGREFLNKKLIENVTKLHKTKETIVRVLCITANGRLKNSDPEFYKFLIDQNIEEVSFSAVTDQKNHISILGVLNPKNSMSARLLLEDITICFSIAIFNKKYLNKTETVAVTDSLTGLYNRVKYKMDVVKFNSEKPENFACIYVDVNELHSHNNKFGHSAGDEMLLYIANSLKDIFFGYYIYRMGGDEFLVFTENVSKAAIEEYVETLFERLRPMDYHVAIGLSFKTNDKNMDELVREAEVMMYEAKAQYYQNKESKSVVKTDDVTFKCVRTGIREIDTLISVMKKHYLGIYRVSLDTDEANGILMPSYFNSNEKEKNFSRILSKYITEFVNPDFSRALISFLNYDALKKQLQSDDISKITYKRNDGEVVILSVYPLKGKTDDFVDTLWVFEKVK